MNALTDAPWKRNLAVIWMGELLAISGFSLIMPFLPYYVQELGVRDPRQVALWTGMLTSAHAVAMTVASPFWGNLADRYGRKLMVERAMFGGAFVLALMGFAQDVYQLLALRLLQGALTGTVVAATTLVASSVPRERIGSAVGLLQMAIYLGASLGPALGGVLADTVGYRPTFWVTAGLLFVAGVSVHVWVHEAFRPPPQARGSQREGWKEALRSLWKPALASMLLVRALSRIGLRTVDPMLPLFVQELQGAGTGVASATGVVVGAAAAAGAVGAALWGRVGDRLGHRRVLAACICLSALLYLPQFFAQNVGQILALQVLTGLVNGGLLTSITSLLAQISPEGREGLVYGLDSSATSVANFLGPMLGAGVVAWWGVRSVFLAAAGAMGASAAFVLWLLARSNGRGDPAA
jgi:DHA1 family multidrug resistance protein-like MFS transporter